MFALADLDGVAGLAALINGMVLWPIVRSLQKVTARTEAAVAELKETHRVVPRRRAVSRRRR